MSDISAAAILQQILKFNFENHLEAQSKYLELISKYPEIKLLNYQEGFVYGNFPLIFKKSVSMDIFRQNSIETQKYYYPLENHLNSLLLFDRIINLPLHSGVLNFNMKKVKESIENCLL